MSYLYINENGVTIGIRENCIKASYKDGMTRSVPIETLESIQIFGNAQLTSQCLLECLHRNIPVVYYSRGGTYLGRLQGAGHIHAERQRQQAQLAPTTVFAVELSKRIIEAKIHNQIVVLRRYTRYQEETAEEECREMKILAQKISSCYTIEQIMGYEGIAARYYFQGLEKLVEPEFSFHGRSRRPPKDAFNAMLSLGYTILMNEIYGKIENKGLNPYFGFIHKDHEKHPTLASDLMEEWRAVVVDSFVMSLTNGHEISRQHFVTDSEEPGIFLTKEGMKLFIKKLDKKFKTENRYLNYTDYAVSFRRGMDLQIGRLAKAVDTGNPELYEPVRIR